MSTAPILAPSSQTARKPGSHCASFSAGMPATMRAAPAPHRVSSASRGESKIRPTSSTCAPGVLTSLRRGTRRKRAISGSACSTVAEIGAVGDLPAPHPIFDAVEKIARGQRQRIRVARIGPAQHVEHRRRVVDRARDRPVMRQEAHRRGRVGRHQAKARLDAEHARKARRNADRAGAVAAEVEDADPRRTRRRRAGAAAARRAARGSMRLRVIPVSGLSPTAIQPNSGVVVLPRMTAPASLSRATAGESSVSGAFSVKCEPRLVGNPRSSIKSLIVAGTPSTGDSGCPARQRPSDSRAAARATSRSTTQNALSFGCRSSSRANSASAASTGDSFPEV